jgi:hypothetical protein
LRPVQPHQKGEHQTLSLHPVDASSAAPALHSLLVERRLLATQGTKAFTSVLSGKWAMTLLSFRRRRIWGAPGRGQSVGVMRPIGEAFDKRNASTVNSPGFMKSSRPDRRVILDGRAGQGNAYRPGLLDHLGLAAGFLIACASSSTTNRHGTVQPRRARRNP